jgi:hypothetical protein
MRPLKNPLNLYQKPLITHLPAAGRDFRKIIPNALTSFLILRDAKEILKR